MSLKPILARVRTLAMWFGLTVSACGPGEVRTPASPCLADHRSPTDTMLEANQFIAQKQWRKALNAYVWCFQNCLRADPSFVGVRNRVLPRKMVELAKKYPPAAVTLEEYLLGIERRLRVREAVDDSDISFFAAANEALDKPQRTTDLFLVLSTQSGSASARSLIGESVPELLKRRMYREVLGQGYFAEYWAGTGQGLEAMQKYQFSVGKQFVEALAGAHRDEEALQVVDRLTKIDSDVSAFIALAERASSAGNTDLARTIVTRARPVVPPAAIPRLDEFAHGLEP
jgi:hypothetical protein